MSSKTKVLNPPLPEAPETESSLKMTWLFLFACIIICTVALMLVSLPAGLYTVFGAHLSNNYTASTPVYALNIDFVFATLSIPFIGNLGTLFVGTMIIYAGFLFLAARQGTGLLASLRSSVSTGYRALFTNPLTATLILLGAVSLVTVLIDSAQTNAGIPTGSLTGDPFSLLINFTLAPLLEESTFRLILIGIPVLLITLVMLRDYSPMKAARVLWRPSSAWDVDETEEGDVARTFKEAGPSIFPSQKSESLKVRAMKPVVYSFLALSSIIFGYAHYAGGWGPGKISEAALAGFALGYLYVKYGWHTNVLLHWSINYVGTIFSFLAQALFGISWTSNTGSFLDWFPTLLVVFLLGVPSTLIMANELLKQVLRTGRQPL